MITPSDEVTILSMREDEWVSLRTVIAPTHGIKGYTFSHETRCKGNIIAVLAYRWVEETTNKQYLIRSEVTPCWGLEPQFSALTGGWEGGAFVEDAVRELAEESGYLVEPPYMHKLGTCFGTKSTDTVFHLFSVDLTGHEQHPYHGDGSKQDSEGTAHWVDAEFIYQNVKDPIVHVMLGKLEKYWN